jgi:hypothetical protein
MPNLPGDRTSNVDEPDGGDIGKDGDFGNLGNFGNYGNAKCLIFDA